MKNQIKKAVLRLGRPFWKRLSPPFYSRIDKRIDLRLVQTGTGWKQHVPAFLNAVSSVQAFGRELVNTKQEFQTKITQLESQNSLVRDTLAAQVVMLQDKHQELAQMRVALEEVRAQVRATNADAHLAPANASERAGLVQDDILYNVEYQRSSTREQAHNGHVGLQVLNAEKVSASKEAGAKVNLGCGSMPLHEYVNIDMRALPGVDIVADLGSLPFESATLDEVFSVHLLDHFPQDELQRRLLPYWYDLLRPGGTFRAVVADGEAMLASIAGGEYHFEDFRRALFGDQKDPSDFNHNLFTPSTLSQLLESVGFRDVRTQAEGIRRGTEFEFEIAATK